MGTSGIKSVGKKLDLAMSMLKSESHGEALALCTEVINQYPENSRAYRVRSAIYAAMNCRNEALRDINNAIRLDPNDPSNYFTRGRRCLLSDELHEAVKDLTRSIELEEQRQERPFWEAAHFFRAEAYLRLGLYDLALADCAMLPDDFVLYVRGIRSKKDIELEARKRGGR